MFRFICILIILSLWEMAQAQRPSFAGARPPGGLTQKDKYIGAQNTALENRTGLDIVSRFGDSAATQQSPQIINLAYGASQNPPVGVPLVLPSDSYVPLGTSNSVITDFGVPDVVNRFGGNDINNSVIPAAAPIPSAVPASVPVPAAAPASIPVSAAAPASFPVSAAAPASFPVPAAAPAFASGTTSVNQPSRLPIDAHGDREYVNHLNQLPAEQRPFWLINYEAIEALRNNSRPNVGALQTRGSFFGG